MEHQDVFEYPANLSDKFLEVIPDRVYLDVVNTHTNLAIIGGRWGVGEFGGQTMWITLDSNYKEDKGAPGADVRALRDALNFILKEQYGED